MCVNQAAQYLKSPLLDESGIRHGYFSRKGGCSTGIFSTLNAGLGSGDDRDAVIENRRRICESLDCNPDNLATLYQIHSSNVVTATARISENRPKADGIVTNELNVALGVVTADCGPILFSDSKNKIIGAAHAGWKGAFDGVIQNTISAMEKLGAQRGAIKACLGPTISQKNYEVGPEFIARFKEKDPAHIKFFIPSDNDHHFLFDLGAFIANIFEREEIEHEILDTCTYAEEEDFFSYRRTTHRQEKDYGRQLSVIIQK